LAMRQNVVQRFLGNAIQTQRNWMVVIGAVHYSWLRRSRYFRCACHYTISLQRVQGPDTQAGSDTDRARLRVLKTGEIEAAYSNLDHKKRLEDPRSATAVRFLFRC
jgi:hypothetical protein